MRNELAVRSWRVVAMTGVLLLVPLVAMRFDSGVNWTLSDFVVAGALIAGAGLAWVHVSSRIADASKRAAFGVVLLLAFLYVWTELAVGVFFHFGS